MDSADLMTLRVTPERGDVCERVSGHWVKGRLDILSRHNDNRTGVVIALAFQTRQLLYLSLSLSLFLSLSSCVKPHTQDMTPLLSLVCQRHKPCLI